MTSWLILYYNQDIIPKESKRWDAMSGMFLSLKFLAKQKRLKYNKVGIGDGS